MKESSREVLPTDLQRELNKLSPNVTLNSDGSFSVSKMPALFYSPALRPARLETGSGTWKLGDDGDMRSTFSFIENWNQNDLSFASALVTSQGWSEVTLYYYLGDPDETQSRV